MNWDIEFLPEAEKDFCELDRAVKVQVAKGIKKVAQNPLPVSEGGYGKPLGKKNNVNLTGLYKVKFLNIGIRVVYSLIRVGNVMKIIVVSARKDNEAYALAGKRRRKYNV